jgi:UDP-N-acetylmuramoylalanine--D-glutamate ligase
MNIAVLGLGIEGKNAVDSLLDYGHQVYASDLDMKLEEEFNECYGKLEIDLGKHDWEKINKADAIVVSPSLWKPVVLEKIVSKNKFLSHVLDNHRSIFTIGVTGTNGKTTTSLMIKDILEKAGYKVLIGGNAGGGFDGYTAIMLEASENDYDYLIVEVCDMTLDFCSYNFDFDLMVVTNLGYDHINVHGSIENFQEKLKEFIQDKKAIINLNDKRLCDLKNYPIKTYYFDTYPGELELFGNFNRQNAAAAAKVGEILDIPENIVDDSLSSFKPVSGRITEIKFGKSKIIIGKTDNISALNAVLNEIKIDTAILGTPREHEYWRFDIFKEISHHNPRLVGLFPGLDNTTAKAVKILREEGYNGTLKVFNNQREVIDFITGQNENYQNIFIGGNGQAKIMEIKKFFDGIS